jgi:hypothetical protein
MSPNEEVIKHLAILLEKREKREIDERENIKYKKVKDVVIYLAIVGACIFAPKSLSLFKPLFSRFQRNSWKKFNKQGLKWTINRLEREKVVVIESRGEEQIVTITKKGQRKIIKYALDDLDIPKPKKWDGKWRLVLYDISRKKRHLAQILRRHLQRYGFLSLQESVYIYPYPCTQEIEFLRSYYDLGKEIKLLVASLIEDEIAYKEYFGLPGCSG